MVRSSTRTVRSPRARRRISAIASSTYLPEHAAHAKCSRQTLPVPVRVPLAVADHVRDVQQDDAGPVRRAERERPKRPARRRIDPFETTLTAPDEDRLPVLAPAEGLIVPLQAAAALPATPLPAHPPVRGRGASGLRRERQRRQALAHDAERVAILLDCARPHQRDVDFSRHGREIGARSSCDASDAKRRCPSSAPCRRSRTSLSDRVSGAPRDPNDWRQGQQSPIEAPPRGRAVH